MFGEWLSRGSRAEAALRRLLPWPSDEIRTTHPVAYRAACKYVHEHPNANAEAFVAGACWSQGHADASAGRPFDHSPTGCIDYRDGFEDGTEPAEDEPPEREANR